MAEQAQEWWREAIPRFGMRSLFHALCDLGRDDPPEPILDYASGQPWLADQAERFSQLSVLDRTHPYEPGDEQFWASLALLYAASRVRDVLLLAHQPAPANPGELHDMDEMLGRTRPSFAAVPVARVTGFFAQIGCRAVTVARFDPALHEIVVCETAPASDAPITITGQLWPALMIGELVFTRAGVTVRAGAAHARPGVADRSTMYWEYWRRHRPTIDGSFGWGTNSQWQTAFRRDYRTTRGSVFNLDARSAPAPDLSELTGAEAAEFVKNRCPLRAEPDDQFDPPDQMIDERSGS
jgi:hypothetical protein